MDETKTGKFDLFFFSSIEIDIFNTLFMIENKVNSMCKRI